MAIKFVDGAVEQEISAAEATSITREVAAYNTKHSTSITELQYLYGQFQKLIKHADKQDQDRRFDALDAAAKETALGAAE